MFKFVLTCLLVALAFLQNAGAQEAAASQADAGVTAASQMGISELLAQAEYLSANSRPSEAIPLLQEIISRTGEMKGAEEGVQMARLLLGAAYAQIERWSDARACIEEYLSKTPVKDRVLALQVLCQIALAEKKWDELDKTAQTLREQKGLSIQKLNEIELFFVQSLYNGEKYEKAVEVLPGVIEKLRDPEKLRAYRLMFIRCLYKSGKIERLVAELPVLFRGEARNDVALNLTLLNIGDELFDAEQYRQALSIFRLVMSRDELIELNKKSLREIIAKNRKPDPEIEEQIKDLEKIPDYDRHISYRAAQIYTQKKRFWEAMGLFDLIYERSPAEQEGKAAQLQKMLLLFEVGANEEAVAESIAYLEKNNKDLFPRIVCTRLAQFYLRQDKFDEALALQARYADRWVNSSEKSVISQETDLNYLFSFIHFQKGDFVQASLSFDRVARMAPPDSDPGINSYYWKAMCELLQKNYTGAYDLFLEYREKWPTSDFAAAALFRAGVCRFGLQDYEGAKKIFNVFIVTYEDDALLPEALSMYADILASEGLIDEALVHYDRVISVVAKNYGAATDPYLKKQMTAPATYAVLQSAQALRLDAEAYAGRKEKEAAESKYKAIISRVEDYMKVFGEDADWAQGVFAKGKAQIALGQTDAAVKAYLETVLRYGSDPSQEGVASILFDLAEIIKTRQDEATQGKTKQIIQQERDKAASPTLQILLDVLLAELNGTRSELGKTLLLREKDLKTVPPSGLALMCMVLREMGDYSRSEELYNHFMKYHEASPFIVPAYRLRAEDLYQKKDYDAAYILASRVIDLYGACEQTGWAQLMKGNIETAQANYEEAEKTYNRIFSVRLWRGSVSAEAMFRLAELWYAQGNYDKAFAFFQRTYLLYRAHDGGRWAADAYLRSAECCMKRGREPEARNTYRAMLLDEYIRNSLQAEEAKKILGPQETEKLLAGQTNTMETVKGEVAPK